MGRAVMYICHDCGIEFDEDEIKVYKESRPVGFEEIKCCPNCESSDFESLTKYTKDKLENCLDKENFSEHQIDIILELFKKGDVNI